MESYNELVDIEVDFVKEGEEWRDADDRPLPCDVEDELDALFPDANTGYNVGATITVRISGYSIPGTMYDQYGDPGDPPEGEEERDLYDVELDEGELSAEAKNSLFNMYGDEAEL